MSGKEDILETKLDILIKDFQRFREEQEKANAKSSDHSKNETAVQASILTTQKWHTVIGTFMMSVLGYHIMSTGGF